jgi:hypothetical protein
MNLLKVFGIDATEEALRLLLAHSPRHRGCLWRGRTNPLALALVIAEVGAYYEGVELPAGAPADQLIGALVAHAYEPHLRVVLTRSLQRPPTEGEVGLARAGVQGLVEGILPRCE